VSRVSKDELAELQDPETWADDGEVRPPVKSPRAIVSVAFSREDFETVARYAREHGMKTSEFIRHAALDRAVPAQKQQVVVSVSGNVQTSHASIAAPRPKVEVKTPRSSVVAST
jgi:hypothetical protein